MQPSCMTFAPMQLEVSMACSTCLSYKTQRSPSFQSDPKQNRIYNRNFETHPNWLRLSGCHTCLGLRHPEYSNTAPPDNLFLSQCSRSALAWGTWRYPLMVLISTSQSHAQLLWTYTYEVLTREVDTQSILPPLPEGI